MISVSWHPKDGVFHAEAKTRGGTVWIVLIQGAGDGRQEIALFFPDLGHAEAVANAFNNPPPL